MDELLEKHKFSMVEYDEFTAKKKGFKMPEIPEDVKNLVMKYGNRVSGLSNGRRWIDHDFEE